MGRLYYRSVERLSCLNIGEISPVGGLLRGKLAVGVLPVHLESFVGPGIAVFVLRM